MRMRTKLLALLSAAAMALVWLPEATASRGEIRARCDGNKPVILQRPAGTENVQVVCRNGVPDFMITPTPVFKYDPVTQQLPLATPPDFGGWVTVRTNASQSPLIWYNVDMRGVVCGQGCDLHPLVH